MKVECILDNKEAKKTRHKVYHEYLVKWRGLQEEDATWMTKEDILKHGIIVQDLISKGT